MIFILAPSSSDTDGRDLKVQPAARFHRKFMIGYMYSLASLHVTIWRGGTIWSARLDLT